MADADLTLKDIQKENRRLSLKVFLHSILAAVLCFFVYMSVTALAVGIFTKDIGYRYWEKQEDGSLVIVEEHWYADEEPEESSAPPVVAGPGGAGAQKTEPSGSTTTTTGSTIPTNWTREVVRSELSAGAEVALNLVCSLFMLLILGAFAYADLWGRGDRDKNLVQFGHMQKDIWRGLKVGCVAAIPAGAMLLLVLITKLGGFFENSIVFYRLMNIPFISVFNALIPNIGSVAAVPWWMFPLFLVMWAYVPLVCQLGYFLGYKQISLSEKLIYVNPNKKKKRRL